MSSERWEFSCEIKRTTDAGLLIDDGESEVWLPKSQIEFTDDEEEVNVDHLEAGMTVEISIPEWLATAKGLV